MTLLHYKALATQIRFQKPLRLHIDKNEAKYFSYISIFPASSLRNEWDLLQLRSHIFINLNDYDNFQKSDGKADLRKKCRGRRCEFMAFLLISTWRAWNLFLNRCDKFILDQNCTTRGSITTLLRPFWCWFEIKFIPRGGIKSFGNKSCKICYMILFVFHFPSIWLVTLKQALKSNWFLV